ncbi:MAG: hypothetical protein NZM65_08665 [Flavobacteriales bacterium]|nr:hypothetical protein [Flavobacteriales bacterium]MDW8410744.1 hypothetical protein [Flavobacteriales bacterium]
MVYGGYHRVKRLRFYGPHQVQQVKSRGRLRTDTLYFTVPSFQGFDYAGQVYSSDSLKGKTVLIHVLDAHQFDSLPKQIIYAAAEALDAFPDLRFVTVFVPGFPASFRFPFGLTPRLQGDSLRWHFVRMDSVACQSLLHQGLFARADSSAPQFDPASLVLLDRQGHIRGYYSPVFQTDLQNMKKEILHLFREYELAFKTHRLVRVVD